MKDRKQVLEEILEKAKAMSDVEEPDDDDEELAELDAYFESHPKLKEAIIQSLLLIERRELAAIKAMPTEPLE